MGTARYPYLICCCLFLTVVVEGRSLNGIPKTLAGVGDERCMGVLGCFKITSDFFDLVRRPVNLLPQHRRVINTEFHLYTKANIRNKHILNAEKKQSINSSHFEANVPTKFIIHGYIDTQSYGPWQVKLKDEFLLKGRYNVIIVDWSGGNGLPYTQATANSRVVGAEITHLIKTLQEQVGLKPENCHILGHSLGAHAAGYAGELIPGLGRITGLDPAEPYFQGLPPSIRLDETDAEFVDVIHTDSKSILLLGLGMSQAVGHVDFYPNSGTDQPGCHMERIKSFITDGITEGFRRFIGCNHQRSVDFYYSSILLAKCTPVAYQCASWDNFLEAKCTECGPDGSMCAILGERAIDSKGLKQINKKLYLKTSHKTPYCIHHYKVIVRLFKGKDSKDAKGSLEIKLTKSINEEFTSKLTSSSSGLHPGSTYMFLVTSNEDMENLQSVSLRWSSSFTLNPLSWFRTPKIYVDYIKIVPMNIVNQKTRREKTITFCLADRETPIYSGKSTSFTKTKC